MCRAQAKCAEKHTLRRLRGRSETPGNGKGAPLVTTSTDYRVFAAVIRRGLGLDEYASPFSYAERAHVRIFPARSVINGAELLERAIHWDAFAPPDYQRRAFAREFCRWALRASNRDDSDESAEALRAELFTAACEPGAAFHPGENVRFLPVLRPLARAASKDGASQQEQKRRRPVRASRRP